MISVVTVVRNDASGFERTARSVLGQRGVDFEWVIIDGESTDGTAAAIARAATHQWVKARVLPPLGIYEAMNQGIRISQGDWIWLLNAGDFFLGPHAVFEASAAIDSDQSALAWATPVVHVSQRGFVLAVSHPRVFSIGSYAVGDFNHQGVLVRRDAFEQLGNFDTSLRWAADGKFLDLLAATQAVRISARPFVGFVMGGAAASHYRDTIRETRSYRPMHLAKQVQRLYVVKNELRRIQLRFERVPVLASLMAWWLCRRQSSRISVSTQDMLWADHWPQHVRTGCALLSCCMQPPLAQ